MSQPQGKQWRWQLLPAAQSVQNTGPGTSGYLNEPQNTSDVEAQLAQQACHKIQVRLKIAEMFQQYRSEQIPNEYGITITSDPASTEEKIRLTVYENTKDLPLTVKNSGVKAVYLSFGTFDFVRNIFTIKDSHGNRIKTIKRHTLEPGEAYNIKIHFHSDHAGFYEQLLDFKFATRQQPSDKFEIMRLLEVTHRTSFSEELLPTASCSPCNLKTEESMTTESAKILLPKSVVPLRDYPIPKSTKDFIQHSDRYLQETLLNWENYSRRFHMLLHLEEIQLKKDIENYNRNDVTMVKDESNKNLLILRIEGDSGLSPSLLCGHQVQLTPLDESGVLEPAIYKGWIHHDDAEQVYLQFCENFWRHYKEGMRFKVIFNIHRLPLRIQHRAVGMVYKHRLREVLFPTGDFSSHHSSLHSLPSLENNPEQCMAIQHIVAASAKPAPYLVFGPPGTGKTVTLVQAIKQIERTQMSCNILACTPSNSATDHLCEKILDGKIDRHTLYRLYALNSSVSSIPQFVQYNCNLDQETNTLMMPSKEELMTYKIVVTTLITAARLVTIGIPPGHYTYIIVDEAGQAAETECIIPLAGLVKPDTCQVVLVGDPKQLGSIIISKFAKKHGMDVSLLERLMRDIDLYKSHKTHRSNNHFVTKLLRNYRSHPAILKIPNALFYRGQLLPHAPEEKCSGYCEWEGLPKKGFPLIFHGVAGTEERDGNCTSVYNMAEVEVLKEYLKALVDYLHKKGVTQIGPGEIGIIAPYRKQVEKIQITLQKDKDLRKENILVGSVEKFQGKEFNIILVSTVRSNRKLTAHKHRFTLGFLNDEKRFNVAVTRAQALLIVVGDPRVLITDPTWNKFIHYCSEAGGYRGITVSDAEEMSHQVSAESDT